MPWSNLGAVSPNYVDWRIADNPCLSDLIRVRQSWNGEWPGDGFIQVSAIYADGGRYGYERVYPDKEARMLLLPVPKELKDSGYAIRYLAAKLGVRTRTYTDSNWRITFEEWQPAIGSGGTQQTLDGGTY